MIGVFLKLTQKMHFMSKVDSRDLGGKDLLLIPSKSSIYNHLSLKKCKWKHIVNLDGPNVEKIESKNPAGTRDKFHCRFALVL
jgi:hypothetical protein